MFCLIAPPRKKLSSSQFPHWNGGGINFVMVITYSFFWIPQKISRLPPLGPIFLSASPTP
jgi:hypothetical protein